LTQFQTKRYLPCRLRGGLPGDLNPLPDSSSPTEARGLHPAGALSVPPLEENSERNILLDAKPAPELLDLRFREEQVRSVPSQKSFSSLRPPPTARSEWRSRGVHPVGALSVSPLEENLERNLLLDENPPPDHSTSESEKNKLDQYHLRRVLVLSDPRRLPAVDGGLGDYTQWVHSACPHWKRTQKETFLLGQDQLQITQVLLDFRVEEK